MLLVVAALAGCTSLGPMPATTGVSALPAQRPHVEGSLSAVPGFLLSEAAHEKEMWDPVAQQLMALFEPDRWLQLPGLVVAVRQFGEADDTGVEPILGYRRRIDRFGLAALAYGTQMSDESNGAYYEATRVGGELAASAVFEAEYIALHAQLAASATYLSAEGAYCIDSMGLGDDCDNDGSVPRVAAEIEGVYSAATASLALELGPRAGWFHGLRVGGMVSLGHMPRLVAGEQQSGTSYVSAGMSLAMGFGAAE